MKKIIGLFLILHFCAYGQYNKKRVSLHTCTVQSCSTPVYVKPLLDKSYRSFPSLSDETEKNKEDKYYWTPFMWAVALDDTKEVKRILDSLEAQSNDYEILFKEINWRDWAGRTPLYLATEWINKASFKLIMERAIKWFRKDKNTFFKFITQTEDLLHWSPLHSAMYSSFSETVHMLVQAALNVFGKKSKKFKDFINFHDIFGRTPLALGVEPWDQIYLRRNGGVEIFSDELEDQRHVELQKDLLKYSEYVGFSKQLHEVLEAGEREYETPEYKINTKKLHHVLRTARKKYEDNNKLFLDFITTRNGAGWSPLMNAAADGNVQYVDMILSAANEFFVDKKIWVAFIMNNCDIHGRTVWHLAISRRHLDIIKTLIRVQKEIAGNRKKPFLRFMTHRTELNGFTPLIAASYESSDADVTFAIIKLLVQRAEEVLGKGSREFLSLINRKDYDGYSAINYAVTPKVHKFLKSYGAK